jgi:hypothetical protein
MISYFLSFLSLYIKIFTTVTISFLGSYRCFYKSLYIFFTEGM